MRGYLAIMGLVVPLAGFAAEPGERLDGAAFEALTTGATLLYQSHGEPYGTEQYLPGRKVVWAFLGEECRRGAWYEEAGDICFVYEDNNDPQCWAFWKTERGLIARFRGDLEGTPLISVEQSASPLACPGPDVGV
ncbi:MAG: hypothetical protein KDE03_13160 [Rhodobacteraceae bacterium]|nr:hypothetical protein [Paracoccaceae bacterium]